ncbi:MAG: GAF domain-containing protein [Anaerolineae bacterium]|nr:GAF domain-containing protein [Anaerolineae bacterium]
MNANKNGTQPARSLTATLAIAFFGLSIVILLANGTLAIFTNYSAYQETVAIRQQLIAQEASKTVTSFIQEKFSVLETSVEFGNPVTANSATRQTVLENLLGLQPAFRQLTLLNPGGRQVSTLSRLSSTLSAQFESQLKGDDLLAQTKDGQRFISPVYIDDLTSEPLIVIAIPAQNAFGDFQGVLVAELNLKFIWDLVDQIEVGETGYAYVVDNQGNLIAFGDTARVLRGENVAQISEVAAFIENPSALEDLTPEIVSYTGLIGETVVGSYVPLGSPQWAVVTELPTAEANQPIVQSLIASFITILAFAVLAGVAGLFLARRLATPLIELSHAATEIAGGNLAVEAKVSGPAEIAQVSATFNTMTLRLRELIGSLEQRVAERTKALSTVSEISTAASTILDIDVLLQEVVNLSKERFGLYHSHIYLLDDTGENLVLASGAGEVGRQMVSEKRSIPLDREQSLVARAAREREGVTINDVTQEPDFLPNPLLPDTHSELAVPMMVGEKVIGVFDVQSDIVGRFTDADIAVQTTLASQIASAVQNARSYTEVQHSQELLSDALRVARIGNWEYDLEKDLFTFNDHFYSIFRTSVEQVGGYRISSADYARIFVHPDDAPLVGAEIQKSIESKERFFQANLEHRIIFADGEIGYITVNINLERDENGKILRWYGANQDVTERRQLEERNRHRAEYERNLNLITQKIQGTTSMEEALKITARELGHVLQAKTSAQLTQSDQTISNK